jgi:hypothetical protein
VCDLEPGVTVIVPHGGADRLPLLEATLPRVRGMDGVIRVVLVELDAVPRATEVGRCTDFHVFATGSPPFQKTRAMNIGLAFVRTTHFLWLDSDILLPDGLVAEAWRECLDRSLDCLLPWFETHYLSEQDCVAVAAGGRAPASCVPANRLASTFIVPGSAVLVRTAFAHRHGGMAEQFRGWGCEDNAWFIKVRTLGRIGITENRERIVHHLYHPTSGGYRNGADLFASPDYRRNFAILTLMRSYRTPEAFSRRFPAPAHFTAPWTGTLRFACPPGAEAVWRVLQDLYGDAVGLGATDAPADVALPPGATDVPADVALLPCEGDAWDAALAAVCRASLHSAG